MAIDAKDQITHGHIRRVQRYAVGLARRVGITEDAQIRAIEAASLLHDMGKLAVPEYILNKPGNLTPAEFDKMKLHASVGADILSAIDFPYPVVPIVRHHHENWDGTGYPDGIRGSDIPIGARILSVVDCFDALTSDRPYRPKLPDTDAIQILLDRRGTMYDPLVVDTFIDAYRDIAPAVAERRGKEDQPLPAIPTESIGRSASDAGAGVGLDNIAASAEEMIVLFDLAMRLNGPLSYSHAAEVVANHLRRLVPMATYVFYIYDSSSDELRSIYATGEHSDHFNGLRVRRGERLTGWVAANRRTIVNSDPILDLGETVRVTKPRLRSCLSTPLVQGELLVGVLTLYSAQPNNFTEDHRRVVEVVARQAASVLRKPLPTESLLTAKRNDQRESRRDVPTDNSESPHNVYVALVNFEKLGGHHSSEVNRRVIAAITSTMQRADEEYDVLFRQHGAELIALLGRTTDSVVREVARNVAETIREMKGADLQVRERLVVNIGIAAAPHDGSDIDALASAARRRSRSLDNFANSSSSVH
jgi:putative nucleotidyltransferase with HDIG domain